MSSSSPVAATKTSARSTPGLEQQSRLVDVAQDHADLLPAAELLGDGLAALGILLDDRDVVLHADVARDSAAERPGSCDDDLHAFHPIILWNFSTADWWTSA